MNKLICAEARNPLGTQEVHQVSGVLTVWTRNTHSNSVVAVQTVFATVNWVPVERSVKTASAAKRPRLTSGTVTQRLPMAMVVDQVSPFQMEEIVEIDFRSEPGHGHQRRA